MEPVETQSWTTNLNKFFSQQQEDHFVFLLDDYWMTESIDHDMVSKMEREVVCGAVKGDLSDNTTVFAHEAYRPGFVIASPNAQYRTSTQPCVWNRQYMLELLKPGLNPWQFEEQENNPTIPTGRIIGPTYQLFKYANIYLKGKPDGSKIKLINEQDYTELVELGMFTNILPIQR
jgi:hypothetical protein